MEKVRLIFKIKYDISIKLSKGTKHHLFYVKKLFFVNFHLIPYLLKIILWILNLEQSAIFSFYWKIV